VLVEEAEGSGPGVLSGFGVIAVALVAVEAVAGAGVHLEVIVDASGVKLCLDGRHIIRRWVTVLVAEMAHQGNLDVAGQVDGRGVVVTEGDEYAAGVVGNGRFEARATGGREVGNPAADAVADDADLLAGGALILVADVVEGDVDVGNDLFIPHGGHVVDAGLHIFAAVAELGVGMFAVEKGRGNSDVAIGGESVANLLNVLIYAEDFLDDDDGGPTDTLAGCGMADVGNHVQTLVAMHVVKASVTGEP